MTSTSELGRARSGRARSYSLDSICDEDIRIDSDLVFSWAIVGAFGLRHLGVFRVFAVKMQPGINREGVKNFAKLKRRERMERREFMKAAMAAGLAGGSRTGAEGAESVEKYLTLEWFRCRRDQDLQRMRGHLSESLLPAYNRAGVKPVGVFQPSVGPDNPSFLVVSSHASMAAIQEAVGRVRADEKWQKDTNAFEEKWELAYDRRESFLLKSFKSVPGIDVPKVEEGKSNLFELRVYESRNTLGHEKKIAMFDNAEINIFRRVGVNPVFFGATVFGTRMPNLTYMVYYPTWEARAEAWSKFGNDPEWKKISTAPGNSDRELVSSISNQLMTPLPFSEIK